jgi:hypothetical protein
MDDTEIHESRRGRREFIRTNHPDRGGDPGVFIAGLCAFGPEREQVCGPLPTVVIVRRRTWLTRMVTAAGQRLRRGSEPPRVR